MTFTPKPAVEKLPLAQRKSIRDNFEAKRPEYEEKISAVMGVPWTIEVNVNEVYAYAASDSVKNDPGSAIAGYFGPLIKNLTEFVSQYGEDGKTELNTMASSHIVKMAVDDTTKFTYCGSDIKDGTLRLLFHEERLDMFPSDASNDIITALKNAPAPAGSMNLGAKNGIKTDYEAKVEEVRASLAKTVAIPDLKLVPNFEGNYKTLTAMGDKASSGWDTKLGRDTLAYFEGVEKSLKKQKFDSDDMLQEGFQEAISKKEITLQIVDKLDCGGSYNEVVVKDGILIVQTLPSQWGSWTSEAADKLTDML